MKGIQIAFRALSKSTFVKTAILPKQITWNQNVFKKSFAAAAPQPTKTVKTGETTQPPIDPLRAENGYFSRCVRSGRLFEAEKILNGYPSKGLVPNEYTYNIALNLYRKMNDVNKLFKVYQEMNTKGIVPTTITYSTIFSAFEDGGDIKDLERIYQEMKDKNVPLALPVFNIIIKVLSLRGEVSLIHTFLTEITKYGFKPDEYTMSSVLNAYGRKGDIEGMQQQWTYFINQGVAIDERAYYQVLSAYGQKGNITGLNEWLQRYKAAGLKITTRLYNIVIDGYTRARNTDLALQAYEEVKSSGLKPDKETYKNVIKAIAVSSLEDRSSAIDKIFAEMRDTYSLSPDGAVAAVMLQAFSKIQNIQKCIFVLEMIKQMNLGILCISLTTLLERLKKRRMLGQAKVEEQVATLLRSLIQKPTAYATSQEIDSLLNILKTTNASSQYVVSP